MEYPERMLVPTVHRFSALKENICGMCCRKELFGAEGCVDPGKKHLEDLKERLIGDIDVIIEDLRMRMER